MGVKWIVLSRTGEYALQALVYLAQHESEWPITGPRIAESTRIPSKYLSAILGSLVRAGVLTSSPGRGGGFRMVRSPANTRLYEVLAPFEPNLKLEGRPCPFGNRVCSDDDPCAGHDRWKLIREAYRKFLNETSVEQVTAKGPKKRGRSRPFRRRKP